LFLTPTSLANVRDPEQLDENTRATPIEDTPRRGNVAESRTVQGASIAGGAGVASSTLGRDNAEELDKIETNIENGDGLTEHTPSEQTGGDQGAPGESQAGDNQAGEDQTGSGETGGETSGETTGETETGEDGQSADGAADGNTEMVEVPADRPSKHEVHAVEAQVQFALLILIILSVLFVIYARFDDWRNYRR